MGNIKQVPLVTTPVHKSIIGLLEKYHGTFPAPNAHFAYDDKGGFCGYISEQLMRHRGMPWMSSEIEEQIQEDLLEIFCNSHHHANTKEPFLYLANTTLSIEH